MWIVQDVRHLLQYESAVKLCLRVELGPNTHKMTNLGLKLSKPEITITPTKNCITSIISLLSDLLSKGRAGNA